ncbi:hypothetical protein ACIOC1_14200 [Streptomyces sp. NPDC088197]|uniref:hypothetical protein n=1 Tax=unclassified Streptomyces TaxID=2593676 RepID=UPI0033BF06B4
MTIASDSQSVSDELRDRAGAFVNSHVDMWVTVEDDGVLILAGGDAAELFQAATDWLREGPSYTVASVGWARQETEPAYALRLVLRQPVGGEAV